MPIVSLLNLSVDSRNNASALRWHRDLLHGQLPLQEEALQTSGPEYPRGTLYSLSRRACGSRRRASTREEREVWFRRPEEPMPGGLAAKIEAGQGIYCSERPQALHRILHRHPSAELHPFCYHSVQWCEAAGFQNTLPLLLLPLYNNWPASASEGQRLKGLRQPPDDGMPCVEPRRPATD